MLKSLAGTSCSILLVLLGNAAVAAALPVASNAAGATAAGASEDALPYMLSVLPTRQWPEVSVFVTHFCTFCVNQKTYCHARIARDSRMTAGLLTCT